MSIGVWYWLILVLCIVWGAVFQYRGWPPGTPWYGPGVLVAILFVLIGLHLFGLPIKG